MITEQMELMEEVSEKLTDGTATDDEVSLCLELLKQWNASVEQRCHY